MDGVVRQKNSTQQLTAVNYHLNTWGRGVRLRCCGGARLCLDLMLGETPGGTTMSPVSEKTAGLPTAALLLAVCLIAWPAWASQDAQTQPAKSQAPAQQAPQPSQNAEPSYSEVPRTLTLPVGTIITIRTSQFLSSNQNHPGDSFNAELEQPVVTHGWVVARWGQTVMGRVVVAKKAGRIKGTSQLGLQLSRLVLVDGQQIPLNTQLLRTSGTTSRGRDAQAVGTTTGVGAAIGAAAEGGEGAGVGAAIGAAAGVAGILLTRGRPTVIPPETLLTFQLQDPVTISTARSGPAFRPVTSQDYKQGALHHRTQRYAGEPYGPPPPPYWGYGPWGYGPWAVYPGPVFFGYYGFGHRFRGRHFYH